MVSCSVEASVSNSGILRGFEGEGGEPRFPGIGSLRGCEEEEGGALISRNSGILRGCEREGGRHRIVRVVFRGGVVCETVAYAGVDGTDMHTYPVYSLNATKP